VSKKYPSGCAENRSVKIAPSPRKINGFSQFAQDKRGSNFALFGIYKGLAAGCNPFLTILYLKGAL
jgi:hypothetical protein